MLVRGKFWNVDQREVVQCRSERSFGKSITASDGLSGAQEVDLHRSFGATDCSDNHEAELPDRGKGKRERRALFSEPDGFVINSNQVIEASV
jgi:hypothetical protein